MKPGLKMNTESFWSGAFASALNRKIESSFCNGFTTKNAGSILTMDEMLAAMPKPEQILKEVVLWRFEKMFKVTQGMRVYWIAPINMWAQLQQEVNFSNPMVSVGIRFMVPIYPDHERALQLLSECNAAASIDCKFPSLRGPIWGRYV